MAEKQKIRIRLKAYDHEIIDQSTIFFVDWSMISWSYALRRIRIFCFSAMVGVLPTFSVYLLILPIAMDEGLRFAIREGGRTVGAGRVVKINK